MQEFARIGIQSQTENWCDISELISLNPEHYELESVHFSGWRTNIVVKVFTQEGIRALEKVMQSQIYVDSDTTSPA